LKLVQISIQLPQGVAIRVKLPRVTRCLADFSMGTAGISRQMLLMRHDDRATFGRALEDLDRRHRHATSYVVPANP